MESQGDSLAANPKSSARGILQQLKGYVDDVNRILTQRGSLKHYTYEDRFIPERALEMFEIIQSYYNPERDIIKAAGIHCIGPMGYKNHPEEADWYIALIKQRLKI